jgi:pyruvate dehydrogenase (quinone)
LIHAKQKTLCSARLRIQTAADRRESKVTKIASELLVERLIDWGVDTVFGLPGDGINGIMEGLRRHKERIRFVLVHHEEAAAFMATAHAKATGRIGVCLATSGPGGLQLINGLYDAKLDHAPVLAITGMQATSQLGTFYQQEVHLDRVFLDLAYYNAMIRVPVSIPTMVDIAVRTTLAHKTVSHITFPVDIQEAESDFQPYEGGMGVARLPETVPTYNPPRLVPADGDIARAADVLAGGKKTVVLAGIGASGARDQLLEVADRLAAPIVKTLPAKAVVPDDSSARHRRAWASRDAPRRRSDGGRGHAPDGGNELPVHEVPPREGARRSDRDRADASREPPSRRGPSRGRRGTYRASTAGQTTAEIGSFVPRAGPGAMAEWRENMAALEAPDRHPIQPQYLMRVIDRLASDDAILSTDSGTIATWAARHFDIRGDRKFMLSANLATMAPALPYTIAAQIAFPERQCIAFVGDGGFAMMMAEDEGFLFLRFHSSSSR